MANGERCKHCGYQETDHDPDVARAVLENGKRCYRFVSEHKHKRNCPVIGCEGNCDETIAAAKTRHEHVNRARLGD